MHTIILFYSILSLYTIASAPQPPKTDVSIRFSEASAISECGQIVYAVNKSDDKKSVQVTIEEIDVNGKSHTNHTWITLSPSSEQVIGSTRPLADGRGVVYAFYRVNESIPAPASEQEIAKAGE